MNLQLRTIELEPIPPMNTDDLAMLTLIDSYSPQQAAQRQANIENSGIDPQRLALYNVGMVALTGAESDIILQAGLQ